MSAQIIALLCEGPHDVAFITRILKVNGFISNESTKIGAFPSPINSLLRQEAQKADVDDLNLQEVRQVLLPTNTLRKDDCFLFLYSMGGDSKIVTRQKMLSTLYSFIPASKEEITETPQGTKLSIIYLLDADDRGVDFRRRQLNDEINEILGEEQEPFPEGVQFNHIKGLNLGYFIFTEEGMETGKLENILLPLMREDNEKIFDSANEYLSSNFVEERIYKLKLTNTGNGLVETRPKSKHDFDELKSAIGVAGQLQRSGKANTVHISDSDYLTLDKIRGNRQCDQISSYIHAFIDRSRPCY